MNQLATRTTLCFLAATLLLAPSAEAAFPGSNGVVAFERKVGAQDFEIYNASPGGGEGPLTANSVDDRTPAYSPNGTKIAFVRGAGEARDIWIMDANGANQVQRTSAAGADLDPVWSPDGARIAYSRQGPFSKDIYAVNADGSGSPAPLTTDSPGDEVNPAWSPDGSRLAFVSQRDGNSDIWVQPVSGGGLVNLTNSAPGASNLDPAWSPDGSRLTFTRDAGNSEVYVMDSCGGHHTNLTAELPNGADVRPAFSPDGTQIVYASSREGNVELWTMGANGSGKAKITDTLSDESNAPDWQVDTPGGSGGSSACGGTASAAAIAAPVDTIAPKIGSASLSRTRFAASGRGASFAARTARGTRLAFRLSEAATVKFRVERAFKRHGHTRYRRRKGVFATIGKPGANHRRFTGRVRNKKLSPGRYRLLLEAVDSVGNKSKTRRIRFRIVAH